MATNTEPVDPTLGRTSCGTNFGRNTDDQKQARPGTRQTAQAIVPEGKKKKAKKKYQGTHNRRETAEDIEHPFEGRQRKQNPYKKTSNEAVVVHPTGSKNLLQSCQEVEDDY